ncbi:autotransporter secretion outer membrane protein TamA [Novosphingobium kunmingense]|uniref:Autotransporter secretion outer membrane protein TamA n=1 Tax=Novosphingobium kunmingense TaxID=1211806 RepID=A0A2N0H3C3_9SPHN|nr:BamA/TamA family outer membrane protein [Novosphingobium kunmingense]PKB13442.1 autotransporter secretion outer membrane protein TamA [Novosphingobium kunmingense]
MKSASATGQGWGRIALHVLSLASASLVPSVAVASQAGTGQPAISATSAPTVPSPPADAVLPAVEPIVPDKEFDAAIPPIAPEDDPELAAPLETVEAFEQRLAADKVASAAPAPVAPSAAGVSSVPPALTTMPATDAQIAAPLPPLESFEVMPVTFAEDAQDEAPTEVAYAISLNGLAPADEATPADLLDQYEDRSALRQGKGKVANVAQLTSRVNEDTVLIKKLLAAEGWFDARVVTRIDRGTAEGAAPLTAVIDVTPGKRFTFAAIAIAADETVPQDLIRDNLALTLGDPVIAADVLGAEAKVALALPENGYPFAEIGQRDVLLDQDSGAADYTLPVKTGPRGTFGPIVSDGHEAFGADHVGKLTRFKEGEPYDSRKVDDLRQALIATGLFKAVGVEPRRSGEAGPDGTEKVILAVQQDAGPPRILAATGGYGTGEGFRAEASWTHRNLFPPEGALIVSGVAGTQEQGASVVFRRSNAGKRDRTFELAAEAFHSTYDAFSAYTGRLAGRVSYDSTPIWQKRLTYAYGAQFIGTNESVFNFATLARERRTYAIGGLTGQIGFDTTEDLLDPASGFRITALIEPEGSLRRGFAPYVRARIDGSAYYPVGRSLVLAARARAGTIQGVPLDDLAPSRRLYAGGGGSVRGFAYQKLGPLDPAGDPTGGRSLNEASFEARYRFGEYGVVAFADVGQSYGSDVPRLSDLRVGVGLGARIYTNFGPMRLDVATPLGRRPGESRFNIYVSIGQAF